MLRKFGVLEAVLARVLLLIPFQGNNPPRSTLASTPASSPSFRSTASSTPIFAALFPAPSPTIFWIALFLYSVAGRPGRNASFLGKRLLLFVGTMVGLSCGVWQILHADCGIFKGILQGTQPLQFLKDRTVFSPHLGVFASRAHCQKLLETSDTCSVRIHEFSGTTIQRGSGPIDLQSVSTIAVIS